MNKYQKIVLIAGAIALLGVIFTTPKYSEYEGKHVPVSDFPNVPFYQLVYFQIGILRILGVIGVTLLIAYALKDKKDKQRG